MAGWGRSSAGQVPVAETAETAVEEPLAESFAGLGHRHADRLHRDRRGIENCHQSP